MLTGPANGSAAAHDDGEVHQPRVLDRAPAIGHAGPDHHPLARHDRQRPAREVAEHVDRELRAVEVLLHDRVGHVVDKERQLARRADRVRADAAAAEARLDEQRECRRRRQLAEAGMTPRPRCRVADSVRQVAYLSLHTAVVSALDTATATPQSRNAGAAQRERRQLVVDRRHDEADALGLADGEDFIDVSGVGRQRHAVGAVGRVHRRRQRVHVGHDDGAAAAATSSARRNACTSGTRRDAAVIRTLSDVTMVFRVAQG